MAGTVAITYSNSRPGIKSVTWAWTSDASGDANGTDTVALSGEAIRWVTNPGAAAPTTLYDIVVNDVDGADVAAGLLANRSATATEQVYPAAATYHAFDGKLSLVVSAAGASKEGTLTMYYR